MPTNHHILTIGSALIDIFVKSDEFTMQPTGDGVLLCQMYGEKVEIDDLQLLTGGGAGNTAVGFSRLGFETSIVAEMGQDLWAEHVANELEAEGVKTDFLVEEKKEKTGMSVVLVGPDGGRTILVHRGAASQLDPTDLSDQALTAATWIHLTNLDGRQDTLRTLFEQLPGSSTKLSWTPGKGDLQLVADGTVKVQAETITVLLLNQEEWELVAPVQEELLQVIPTIVITNGRAGGSVYQDGTLHHEYSIEQVTPLEETGAGDAFAVGFVAGMVRGEPLEACTAYGKHNAASVVQQVGAKAGLLKSFPAA